MQWPEPFQTDNGELDDQGLPKIPGPVRGAAERGADEGGCTPFINSVNGAEASAAAYSICETAKANNLNVYRYMEHILTELPKLCDQDGNIDTSRLDYILPWSAGLPAGCHKQRR